MAETQGPGALEGSRVHVDSLGIESKVRTDARGHVVLGQRSEAIDRCAHLRDARDQVVEVLHRPQAIRDQEVRRLAERHLPDASLVIVDLSVFAPRERCDLDRLAPALDRREAGTLGERSGAVVLDEVIDELGEGSSCDRFVLAALLVVAVAART